MSSKIVLTDGRIIEQIGQLVFPYYKMSDYARVKLFVKEDAYSTMKLNVSDIIHIGIGTELDFSIYNITSINDPDFLEQYFILDVGLMSTSYHLLGMLSSILDECPRDLFKICNAQAFWLSPSSAVMVRNPLATFNKQHSTQASKHNLSRKNGKANKTGNAISRIFRRGKR